MVAGKRADRSISGDHRYGRTLLKGVDSQFLDAHVSAYGFPVQIDPESPAILGFHRGDGKARLVAFGIALVNGLKGFGRIPVEKCAQGFERNGFIGYFQLFVEAVLDFWIHHGFEPLQIGLAHQIKKGLKCLSPRTNWEQDAQQNKECAHVFKLNTGICTEAFHSGLKVMLNVAIRPG